MRKTILLSFHVKRILNRIAFITLIVSLLIMIAAGCTAKTAEVNEEPRQLEPIVVPTMPATIPGYTEVDPDTGLHMTGTPTEIDFDSYRLEISGNVDHVLSLTYDELRLLPKMTATPKLVCERVFVDTATWSGASLKAILDMAGVHSDATEIIMKSADGYAVTLTSEDAMNPENFLAYELEGETLPVLHGFPLRAVLPGMTGNNWIKWLIEIMVV